MASVSGGTFEEGYAGVKDKIEAIKVLLEPA